MSKTSLIPVQTNQALTRLFSGKTPKEFIKYRPGAGGQSFPYVEIGYVITQLNEAFNFLWDWELVTEQIGNRQVWVKGILTVYLTPEMKLSKTAYGGNDIKFLKGTTTPVDIANDLKAASADALKKAGSMLGIAADVFYKEISKYQSLPAVVEETPEEKVDHGQLMKKLFAMGKDRGFDEETVKKTAYKKFSIKSMTEISSDQILDLIESLETKYQPVEKDEEPKQVPGQRDPSDCGNPDCKRGPDGTRAKAKPGSSWCSDECKEYYYPDSAKGSPEDGPFKKMARELRANG